MSVVWRVIRARAKRSLTPGITEATLYAACGLWPLLRHVDKEKAEQRDVFGWTALHYAMASGSVMALNILNTICHLDKAALEPLLLVAIEYDQPTVMNWALDQTDTCSDPADLAHVDTSDEVCRCKSANPAALVRHAIECRAAQCLKALLDRCSCEKAITAEDCWGEVPLVMAVRTRQPAIVRCILEHQPPQKCALDILGRNAAHHCDSVQVMEVLDEFGMDCWHKDLLGQTPFDLTSRRRNAHLMEFLLIVKRRHT